MTLGTRILFGVVAGLAVGIFFGEMVGWLQVVGDVYVGLLQMTVLPYIFVSLVSKIGQFTYERAAQVASRALFVQLTLWAIVLGTVVIFPFSLPAWEAGTFFSASLVEESGNFDFLDLYLPTNPFGAFADAIVPAAVVFSILLGIALIPISSKNKLLDVLHVIGDAMANIAKGVMSLAPYGTFALAAAAAGTASLGELLGIGGYVFPFTIAVVLLTFVLYPALVATLTPFRVREVLGETRGALLTALATGKMFAVLPLIIEAVRSMLVSKDVPEDEARDAADVLVPLAYPFPNAGKFLAILFVPTAAWFIGQPLELRDYPLLLSAGLLAFFGNPVAATLFLLALFRLPSDLITLFLIAGIWGARVGDVLGVMHLSVFSLLTASSERGWLRIRPAQSVGWLTASVAAVLAAAWTNHALVSWSIAGEPPLANRVIAMQPYFDGGGVDSAEPVGPNPEPQFPDETVFDRIHRTGILRVGFEPDNPPFSYENSAGQLVGLEVDLIHRLAVELGAQLRLVPYDPDVIESAFDADHFDLAIGGVASIIAPPDAYLETDSYLELNAALMVLDYRVKEFRSISQIRSMDQVRLAYVDGGVLVRTGRHGITGLETTAIDSADDFLLAESSDFDALLTTAETGAINTMIYPQYSVVIPDGFRVRVPLVMAVADDEAFAESVNRFLRIKRADGTVETLYEHWILGEAVRTKARRWSVVEDVFGWKR